jgi:Peptidase family C25/Secretion system C-terminal sorting domain
MKGITFFLLFVTFSSLHSQPVTLRDTTNQYDYIIITIPEFVNACAPFRQHKETVRDFRTLIVDTTQIIAEFDSSSTPQDNIRDFISYAGTFWKEPKPKFFLIAGTVDDIPNFQIPFPTQPTISYNSDYFYSQNIYENDSTTTDFYIGRIPNRDTIELNNYFSKVIEYESNNTLSDWMNNNLFICENDIQFGFLEAAFSIEARFPGYIRSFFIVDDTSLIYYGDKDSIYKAINERGNAIVWFEGHNRDSFCINPDYFNLSDLTGLDNPGVPFVIIYTGNQQAIIDTNTNMTREMLMQENAGSMGGIVFVGTSYWGITQVFQNDWANRMFDPTFSSIGDIFNLDIHPSAGLYIYMKKITNIWADPSLKLKYDTTVGVEEIVEEIPQSFLLYQNYPNPFNPSTTIKFALPVDSRVKINVYNTVGQLFETLVDKEMESGYHEVNFNAARLASGFYLYQLQAGEFVSVRKMILLK